MRNLKQHQYLAAVFVIFLITACKKNKTLAETKAPEEQQVPKVYVPEKIETAGLVLDLKYKENSTLLTQIAGSEGSKTVITYTAAQQPSKLEKYKTGKLYRAVFYQKDSKQNISKTTMFDYDEPSGSYTPLGFYTLAYNNLNQPAEISYHNNKATNNLVSSSSRSYDAPGNVSAVATLNYPGQPGTLNYTFDTKKGISSHIPYSWLFALESEHWFLVCVVNNILSCSNLNTAGESCNFSYEYNKAGYPEKMIINRNTGIQTLKITYKELPLQSLQ